MERIEKLVRQVQLRMGISAGVYVLFAILAAVYGVQGRTYEGDATLILIVALLASFAVLPRSTMPKRWPRAESVDAQDRQDMLRDTLRHLEMRATYFRIVYIVIGLFLLLMLPMMGL